jgi:hypothetical protein
MNWFIATTPASATATASAGPAWRHTEYVDGGHRDGKAGAGPVGADDLA